MLTLLLRRLRPRLLDGELVFDAKRSRHPARPHAGDGLVALRVHHAEQYDPAVLHDDVDGVVADWLHAGEPQRAYRVKAAAEWVPVTPEHAAARCVPRQKRIA